MTITRQITVPITLYQRWQQYQQSLEPRPKFSTTLAQLLDRHLTERERAVSQR